ncbi:hypothetical protein ERO13_A10G167050v2 [Gossypium hirsutum]|uniref:Uncharacterized protein n=1 Tax=Gossypium darwinii TaxID=34276 RepID=A0A5D2F0M5_GOSDA|nr:hypothetical protein ERO13_A10G167050v2 [Gossypium hirsutum]TYG99513.1 hypothetical protein ES288_A10G201100v1 [Gossypium darwinii]
MPFFSLSLILASTLHHALKGVKMINTLFPCPLEWSGCLDFSSPVIYILALNSEE